MLILWSLPLHATPPIDGMTIELAAPRAVAGGHVIAGGDLDGDGDGDLAALSFGIHDGVWVYECPPSPFSESTWSSSLAREGQDDLESLVLADLDGDGDLDIVAGNSVPSPKDDTRVWIYRNDGTPFAGRWPQHELAPVLDLNGGAFGLDAADMDNDGDVDIVTAGYNAGVVAWENDGTPWDGGWGEKVVFMNEAAGRYLHTSAALADLDGDGDPDIVLTMDRNPVVYAYENDGTPFAGSWSGRMIGTHADDCIHAAVVDLDLDGDLDIASVGFDSTVRGWINSGAPFSAEWTGCVIGTQEGPIRAVIAGDYDRDGDMDLVAGSVGGGSDQLCIYQNNGSPFAGPWSRRVVRDQRETVDLVSMDLDRDGLLDVAGTRLGYEVMAWQNRGVHASMPFATPSASIGSLSDDVLAVAVADLDRDGWEDVVAAGKGSTVVVWRGDGARRWGASTTIGSHTGEVTDLALSDLDRDGDLDLVSSGTDHEVKIWQCPASPFTTGWTEQTAGIHAADVRAVGVADLDHDGLSDLVSGDVDNVLAIWRNDGAPFDGMWSSRPIGFLGGTVTSIATGDLDEDGVADVLVGCRNPAAPLLAMRTPVDPFVAGAWSPVTVGTHGARDVRTVSLADLDRDGDLDALSGGYDDAVCVWENGGAPFAGSWNGVSVGSHSDVVWSVATADLDGDDRLEIISAGRDNVILRWASDGSVFAKGWTGSEVGSHSDDVTEVSSIDVDHDGDLDLVSVGRDNAVVMWRNMGGSAGVEVLDALVGGSIDNSTEAAVFDVTVRHNGVPSDRDLEMDRFEVQLMQPGCWSPLSSATANAMIDRLRVRLDDGDGFFETDGSDGLVADIETLSLSNGNQAVVFTDDGLMVQISHGAPRRYWISVLTTSVANQVFPGAFCARFDPDRDALIEGDSSYLDFSVSIEDSSQSLAQGGFVPVTLIRFEVE
jgi:hypothetical protein